MTNFTLPSEATGHAYALSGEEADDARSMVELFLAAHAGPKKAKGFTPVQSAGETQYRVFEIGIDNVDYENAFHVEVTLPQAVSGQEDSYRLYHIHEGEVTPIDSFEKTFRAVGNRQVLTGFAFDTDDFSQFVLSYTVDFYYGEYEYHLEGEGEILLSNLFALLDIEQDITNVEFVEFTNAELIKVQKLALDEGQDWLLTSLAPFQTTEWLTIEFEDGSMFQIRVEDALSNGNWTVLIKTADELVGVVNGKAVVNGVVEGSAHDYTSFGAATKGKTSATATMNNDVNAIAKEEAKFEFKYWYREDGTRYTDAKMARGNAKYTATSDGQTFTAYFAPIGGYFFFFDTYGNGTIDRTIGYSNGVGMATPTANSGYHFGDGYATTYCCQLTLYSTHPLRMKEIRLLLCSCQVNLSTTSFTPPRVMAPST